MKIKIYLLSAVILCALVGKAETKMVYYHDDAGKIHYVNTDFSKVPEKYKYQVADQLAEPSPPSPPKKAQSEVSPTPSSQPGGSANKPKASVKVFVNDTCGEACSSFELALQVRNIAYERVDINKDPQGKQMLEMTSGTVPLPITCVNVSKCVIGPNVAKLVSILEGIENAKP